MRSSFEPTPGAAGWQVSNPPILAIAPLIASLELFAKADPHRLQAKSERLTAYLDERLRAECSDLLSIITPQDARGAQLSLRLQRSRDEARAVFERLLAAGVICDWREPDIIRVAPVPLYNRFTDVWDFVQILKTVSHAP